LLLQVVYHARLAEEDAAFAFADVAAAVSDKMIRRHPHVFGDTASGGTAGVRKRWDEIKAEERARKATEPTSALGDVPAALPALTRAAKLQKKASAVGFDWPDVAGVVAKVHEELAELEAEIAVDEHDRGRTQAEIGDLLFSVANLARHLNVDPETALRATNRKFVDRFAFVEQELRNAGKTVESAALDEMDEAWNAAKKAEKS